MIGDFEAIEEDLAGRVGRLDTAHGRLLTPAFFPVVNPFRRELGVTDISRVGFSNLITNSYFLMKRGVKQKVHEFLNFDGVVMTDSGAYQVLQYGGIEATNREVVEYELQISPDIAVFLDLPTGDTSDRHEAIRSVEETNRRAEEIRGLIANSTAIWAHPIQGGTFLDLVRTSALAADSKEEFKMLALGSPTPLMEGYDYRTLVRMVVAAKTSVSRGKPFHLFGGGVPHLIPLAVALGVDSFDSASYVLYARDGRYMTRERVYRVEDLRELPCSCPICSSHTAKELMESEERSRLLALHNLYKIREEVAETRVAVQEGRLFEYVQQKVMSHPALYSAFREFRNLVDYLERYDPRTKGEPRGLFLFNGDSLFRPEVVRHKRRMDEWKTEGEVTLVCYNLLSRPFVRSLGVDNTYVITPFFGIVPANASEAYPLSQFEEPGDLDPEVLEDMRNSLKEFLRRNRPIKVSVKCDPPLRELLHVDSVSAPEL
ncbi:tRNA guanosine(15) transglycosylase TgtA [Sulfodiicoccus acidiphilus]|uniref:tRNA-guanine(15) transglycosylase n=1 Tax=Sulfodiicoccus acidiphilus TaxID=1670455 RepID=A0A348B1C7_9CREN|nr:tRNA guanosine(15) transglycosylase TgtA [Sulfodiicoccus acidiphilus]BBD71979.1 tRNA guanosine(15) transglycosylase TgtA [Sulfodiicoccus acidiphilus]GGT91898.1 tRNA guanosine(15) transglycosylase TgtA [Sulfodiicoccus acidiphilus]